MPQVTDALGLLCNKTLLTEAGLSAAPTTWDELVEAGKKVTDLAAQKYGFYMRGDWYWSQPFIWCWGGALFNVDEKGKASEIVVNSPESVNGWTYLKDKILGVVAPATWDFQTDYDNMNAGFKAGTIMCILQGPWQVADILTGDAFTETLQPRHRAGAGRLGRQHRFAGRRPQLGRQPDGGDDADKARSRRQFLTYMTGAEQQATWPRASACFRPTSPPTPTRAWRATRSSASGTTSWLRPPTEPGSRRARHLRGFTKNYQASSSAT